MACRDSTQKFKPVIVAHGGALAVPDDISEATLEGVKETAKIGYRLLRDGKSSTDAVIAVVCALEDNPLFDAGPTSPLFGIVSGKGSALNSAEDIEMHAIVMEGDTANCGGVIGIQGVKNPVQVARLVMEKTNHNVITGKSALALAREHNLQEMPREYFFTDRAKKELQDLTTYGPAANNLFRRGHDTVGAVALDMHGNLACATSTGGITGQMPGRVSDCPVPGAGGYADNDSIAVSATGRGEAILRVSLARTASFYASEGYTPQESVEKALHHMEKRVGGHGGAIAVNRQGQVGVSFTTTKMSWTSIGDDFNSDDDTEVIIRSGISPGDFRSKILED